MSFETPIIKNFTQNSLDLHTCSIRPQNAVMLINLDNFRTIKVNVKGTLLVKDNNIETYAGFKALSEFLFYLLNTFFQYFSY